MATQREPLKGKTLFLSVTPYFKQNRSVLIFFKCHETFFNFNYITILNEEKTGLDLKNKEFNGLTFFSTTCQTRIF